MKGGKRNPPPIQRMEADDLMAAVFPGLAQCQENAAGPIEIPDHPLVRQTLHDCLHEAMDVDATTDLLGRVETGGVGLHLRETTEPSPLSHEILNGRPFTFLDDAPLEERRTRAVVLRRGLPETARDLGRLDPEAIARVREEAAPAPRDAEELHDTLLSLVVAAPRSDWEPGFAELAHDGRAARVATAAGALWCATEQRAAVEALFPGARFQPDVRLPSALAARGPAVPDEAAAEAVRGHLDASGPLTLAALAQATRLSPAQVEQAVARLEAEGFLLRGSFSEQTLGAEEVCARRLLARIHLYTHERLRREIEPVTAQDFLRFLLRWQHVAPGTQREGRRGVLSVVEQLQGFELAAGSWEEAVLPARVLGYRREWLDGLCLSGEVVWARLGLRTPGGEDEPETGRGGVVPSRATPIAFALREELPALLAAARGDGHPTLPGDGPARDLYQTLRARGALFHGELVAATRRLPVEVEQGLWDLVSRGLVAADGFESVRALLGARERERRGRREGRLRRGPRGRAGAEGRWALLPPPDLMRDPDERAQAVAEQLLARWGVVFRDLLVRETLAVSWREILWALRRLEARGAIRGGRFVTGFVGEQYALPGAVEALRRTRRLERTGETVRLSAVDPLNLVGVLTPGPRIPAVRTQQVVYRDGLPLRDAPAAAAGERGLSA
jgi:ATP-dependent Lhr-like helicase